MEGTFNQTLLGNDRGIVEGRPPLKNRMHIFDLPLDILRSILGEVSLVACPGTPLANAYCLR